jgi:hypothetical protein
MTTWVAPTRRALGELGVSFVDDAGVLVEARGEIRKGDGATVPRGSTTFATAGGYRSMDGSISPKDTAEIRFQLPDGSFTAWQALPLEFDRHFDPDFGGPGCSCTWYNAHARVTVPIAARVAVTDAAAP